MKRSTTVALVLAMAPMPVGAASVAQAYLTLDGGDHSERVVWAVPPYHPTRRLAGDAQQAGKFSIISCARLSRHGQPQHCRAAKWPAADPDSDVVAAAMVRRARVAPRQTVAFRARRGTDILVTIRFGNAADALASGPSCPPTLCRIEPGRQRPVRSD